MKCILMNKNTEVLVALYDEVVKVFTKIVEIKNIEYAPYILQNNYDVHNFNNDIFRNLLSNWFKGRGIPSWRDKLDLLLYRLNIRSESELLDKAFGLSLSDQYWIKPAHLDIKYDDINFFDHDFDYSEFLEASLSLNNYNSFTEQSLKTPNNTTDGMLKKAWVIENGGRYLVKSGYKNDILQPFNEVLASMVCDRLGFDYVPYELDLYKDMVVSKCPCFITKNTEFIPASQIIDSSRHDSMKDYEEYIDILEKNGIKEAREKLENMYILDYLIMNEDRHLNNFGVIRDVNTLEWLDVAPIFDNGQGLNIQDYDDEIIILGQGRFFYEIKSFDEIINVVKNIKRIDVSKLDGLVDDFNKLLYKYQKYTKISNNRILKICFLLNRQIDNLIKLINA